MHPQLPGSTRLEGKGAQAEPPQTQAMEVMKLYQNLLLMSLKPIPARLGSHLHLAPFLSKIALKLAYHYTFYLGKDPFYVAIKALMLQLTNTLYPCGHSGFRGICCHHFIGRVRNEMATAPDCVPC